MYYAETKNGRVMFGAEDDEKALEHSKTIANLIKLYRDNGEEGVFLVLFQSGKGKKSDNHINVLGCLDAGREHIVESKGKRLTAYDWDDVADLCDQGATMADTGYENHTRKARDKARDLMLKMAMYAHNQARKAEKREGKLSI
jgi:hypothetical protein